MASTPGSPAPESPQASIGSRYAQRAPPSPANRSTEAGRSRTLRRDKDNFSTLHDRSKKIATQGPYKIRPPVKISTKTIDTDTIGRINKGNQKMSQFLYNLANEPSVGLYHVNDHIRRTVPRIVETRKQLDFQSVELDKSSCDIDEILPNVRTIGSLTSFKSMQSILLRSLQLTVSRSPTPSASSSQRSLGPPTPNHTSQPSSPGGSQRYTSSPSPSPIPVHIAPEPLQEHIDIPEKAAEEPVSAEETAETELHPDIQVDAISDAVELDAPQEPAQESIGEPSTPVAQYEALEELDAAVPIVEINHPEAPVEDPSFSATPLEVAPTLAEETVEAVADHSEAHQDVVDQPQIVAEPLAQSPPETEPTPEISSDSQIIDVGPTLEVESKEEAAQDLSSEDLSSVAPVVQEAEVAPQEEPVVEQPPEA